MMLIKIYVDSTQYTLDFLYTSDNTILLKSKEVMSKISKRFMFSVNQALYFFLKIIYYLYHHIT